MEKRRGGAGGQISRGNFKYDRERAVEAGRIGGKLSKRTSRNSAE